MINKRTANKLFYSKESLQKICYLISLKNPNQSIGGIVEVFKQKVLNTWGKKGENWLTELPSIIESLALYWKLNNIKPVDNMSYNYVAFAIQANKTPVVIKISCDEQLISDEYQALRYFDGCGAIRVLDFNQQHHALLLEQANPGESLNNYTALNIEDKIQIYAHIVQLLSSRPSVTHGYKHIRLWCKAIDKINDHRIEHRFVEMALTLREDLLHSQPYEYVCHGDLHLENIIQQGNQWLACDPKGIIGEVAFEAAAFDLLERNELLETPGIQSKLIHRINQLATALNLPFERLLSWIFLRAIISAQWFIEDKGDPSSALLLASLLYPLLSSLIKIKNRFYVLQFEPLQEQHLLLLHHWFHEPLVKKCYVRDRHFSLNDIKEKYLPRIQGKDNTHSYIVHLNNKCIGFIQYYTLSDHLPEGITNNSVLFDLSLPQNICGLDFFIADKDCRGRGYGTQIILEFIKRFLNSIFEYVIVDPEKNNTRAIHCYEKCGFEATYYSQSINHIIMVKPLD